MRSTFLAEWSWEAGPCPSGHVERSFERQAWLGNARLITPGSSGRLHWVWSTRRALAKDFQ
ncbi:MAG: hypothetical protein EBS94_01180, partial [Proteobacteria bacterium]|nr:hypothetical protein [Pseudomonadota bacterium]